MDKWLKVSIVVAVLFAGAGVFYRDSESTARRADERRAVVEECHRAARMVYDVHWAAACMAQADGHAECDLPDDKAAVVNAWLDEAEQRCMTEVRANLGP